MYDYDSPPDDPYSDDFARWSDAMCERLKDEPSYFSQEEAHIIEAMIDGHDVPDPLKLQDDFERLVREYKEQNEHGPDDYDDIDWDWDLYEQYG